MMSIITTQVAVEGCCHGELEDIYATVRQLQEQKQTKIDLLIICGDFQARSCSCMSGDMLASTSNPCWRTEAAFCMDAHCHCSCMHLQCHELARLRT